jgi:hypothetical protein
MCDAQVLDFAAYCPVMESISLSLPSGFKVFPNFSASYKFDSI